MFPIPIIHVLIAEAAWDDPGYFFGLCWLVVMLGLYHSKKDVELDLDLIEMDMIYKIEIDDHLVLIDPELMSLTNDSVNFFIPVLIKLIS